MLCLKAGIDLVEDEDGDRSSPDASAAAAAALTLELPVFSSLREIFRHKIAGADVTNPQRFKDVRHGIIASREHMHSTTWIAFLCMCDCSPSH
jgi:hypothetical protein